LDAITQGRPKIALHLTVRYLIDSATPQQRFGFLRDLITHLNGRRKNMGTANLQVWITQRGDPCRIATTEHFVYVLECCTGKPLRWCDRVYSGLRTKCGHLELEIPPGCYIVGAVESTAGIPPLGNCLTHIAMVRVNCGDHACVTLFDPSLHLCGTWLGAAINTYVAGRGGGPALPRDVIGVLQNAGKAVEAMLKAIPEDPLSAQTNALATAQGGASKGRAKKGRK
jgi:hypothetical protein